jgi:hypothetical protein
MRNTLIVLVLALSAALSAQNLEIPAYGSDTTFEMVTWNIEWFPKNGQTTANYVAEIIHDLDVDLIAMQELDDKAVFDQMISGLEGYVGYYESSYFAGLAYIYNSNNIEVDTVYEILTTQPYWRPFPRSPMVMELYWNNHKYIVINNHYKCCGDGYLDESDPWDEEKRRLDASNLLEEYISENFEGERVILTGDLNDDIAESSTNNIFTAFLNKPNTYSFVDMEIAQGPIADWSYPSWPSHLDHILITSSLFEDYNRDGSEAGTIKLDQYFNSWNEYDALVSDHRPVAIKIYSESNLGGLELYKNKYHVKLHPVPAIDFINIEILNRRTHKGIMSVTSSTGAILNEFEVVPNQDQYTLESQNYPSGIYYLHLRVGGELVYRDKFIVVR